MCLQPDGANKSVSTQSFRRYCIRFDLWRFRVVAERILAANVQTDTNAREIGSGVTVNAISSDFFIEQASAKYVQRC